MNNLKVGKTDKKAKGIQVVSRRIGAFRRKADYNDEVVRPYYFKVSAK